MTTDTLTVNQFLTDHVELSRSLPIGNQVVYWARIRDIEVRALVDVELDVSAVVYSAGSTVELRLLDHSGAVLTKAARIFQGAR